MPPARTTPRGRPPRERARYGLYVALGLAVVVLPVVVLSFINGTEGDQMELDASLCPVDAAAIAGRTVLLLDVGKPVSDRTAGLAAELLHRVTLDMAANAELQVYLVAANPLAPRIFVERLCKPYASDDLAVSTAKDLTGESRDCDDLPAQLPRHLRTRATQFCERRDALRRRIAGIVAAEWPAPIANAYLVEAIEDTRLALARFASPSLYVFSDMLQHAEWYSHAERGPNKWTYDEFARAREQQAGLLSEAPPDDHDLAVTVYYVPRSGLTEHPRVARAHQRFWRRYFADVGSLTFEEQPTHVAYEVRPFAGRSQDDASTPVGEVGQGGESVASEVGTPPPRVPAAEPTVPAEEGDADAPTVAAPDADVPVTITDVEPEASQDAPTSGNAPAAGGSLADTAPATESAQPDENTPALGDAPGIPEPPVDNSANDGQESVAPPPPTIAPEPETPDPPRTDAAPATGSAQPDENAAHLGTDGQEGVAPPPPTISALLDTPDPPDLAASPEPTDPGQSFCEAVLKPEFQGVDFYPLGGNTRGRRSNFGSAEIVVAYTINEDGETVDNDVAVQSAGSTVDLPRYTDLFTRRAEQIVRGWSYDFVSEDGCEKRQQRVVRLKFSYRR